MISGNHRARQTDAWTDERLVEACLNGSEDAWSALIDKYKNLIYSIPVKYGIPRDDAGEIFQQVCLGLLSELPSLRDPKSLAGWLIKVTAHKCFRWMRRENRHESVGVETAETTTGMPSEQPDARLFEVEREQILREALLEVNPRCRALIHMLFFENPAVPYEEVAKNLRIARGSVGFIRMRCLRRLRLLLRAKGF